MPTFRDGKTFYGIAEIAYVLQKTYCQVYSLFDYYKIKARAEVKKEGYKGKIKYYDIDSLPKNYVSEFNEKIKTVIIPENINSKLTKNSKEVYKEKDVEFTNDNMNDVSINNEEEIQKMQAKLDIEREVEATEKVYNYLDLRYSKLSGELLVALKKLYSNNEIKNILINNYKLGVNADDINELSKYANLNDSSISAELIDFFIELFDKDKTRDILQGHYGIISE